MTAHEWNTCTNARKMLELLRDNASDRKLRLFTTACYRHDMWNRYFEHMVAGSAILRVYYWLLKKAIVSRFERILEMNEKCADGMVSPTELAQVVVGELGFAMSYPVQILRNAVCVWYPVTVDATDHVLNYAADGSETFPAHLLRCIFGNPMCPATIRSAWLTANVNHIAQGIYEQRRFADMPVLADALEDAGCDDARILEHCRSGEEHVRGCWVVDRILDKE
jgi:hypothetical protein